MQTDAPTRSSSRTWRHPPAVSAGLLVLGFLTPPLADAQTKPFPQHTAYAAATIRPNHVTQSQLDTDVKGYYSQWKSRYLMTISTANPVQKYVFYNLEGIAYPTNAVSCSEGHGYGMLATVIMAGYDASARTDFDALFYFFKAHTSTINPSLMAWQQINVNGQIVDNAADGDDSATDGDMDIALSLLMADKQWGSTGAINYKSEGVKLIQAILNSEVNQSEWILKLGDWASNNSQYGTGTRSSDFMLGHLRTFAKYDTVNATLWTNILNRTAGIVNYQYNSGGSQNTGLLPDFFSKNASGNYVPVTGTFLESKHDGDYSWNACRTPWRLSMDFLMTGSTLITAQLTRLNAWISNKSKGNPANIKAGYLVKNGVNGTAYVSYNELAFTAPFAVSAMLSSNNQSWLNELWKYMVGFPIASGEYYGNSLKLHSMLVASGNWWMP